MKLSYGKCQFFEIKIEFLGHLISKNRITVDPRKVQTIQNYPLPTNLRELRSFLGLANYYRKFVKDYAKIIHPLIVHLSNDNGRVGKKLSPKFKIQSDENARSAFELIKQKLQEKVELYQPDFSKPFELTTDASNFGIGAVLSQNDNPITFISRSLSFCEQKMATNKRELLAIVWALQSLRNYLYGIADLTIFTDHQPFIFCCQ